MIGVEEKAPIAERAVFADIERDDLVLRSRRETHLAQGTTACPKHGDAPVRGKGEAVGLLEISHPAKIAAHRIEAVDAAVIEFGIGESALIGHDDPENRVGEPDPVGSHRDIVGRVDPPALEMRHDRLGLVAIVAAATDAAPAMLAIDELAVGLDGVGVHEPGAIDHDLDMAIGIPAEKPPVGHVGPDESLLHPLPGRPLGVDRALMQLEQWRIGRRHFRQPIIVDLETAEATDRRRRPGAPQQDWRRVAAR